MGTMGSRSLQVGGSAVQRATDEVLEKAKRLAAHLLEADTGDIEVVHGQGLGVTGSPASSIPWAQLAAAASDPSRTPEGFEGGLAAENDFETPDATYPFGTHLAVVEVDTETGLAHLVRHITVDDSGRIHNEKLLEGQVHGGIAQGVAQALFEEIAFDEDGNNVTASLASYAIPSAGDLPNFETERTQTPSPRNPLGAKGIGESGAIGATPAVWNAVVDALVPFGVRNIDMPATPQRVWQAISCRELIVSRACTSASTSSIVVPSPMLARTAPGSSGSRPARSSSCRRRDSASGISSSRVISGCAQKQPWRTPIAYSSLRRAASACAVWPSSVKLATPTRSSWTGHSASWVRPSMPSRPVRRRAESARSRSATVSMPIAASASHAAANATAPITFGEPAS